jgi:hypothetical protein
MPEDVYQTRPNYVAHSLAFVQSTEDWDMFASFGVINTPISCLLFGFFIFILSDASFV